MVKILNITYFKTNTEMLHEHIIQHIAANVAFYNIKGSTREYRISYRSCSLFNINVSADTSGPWIYKFERNIEFGYLKEESFIAVRTYYPV